MDFLIIANYCIAIRLFRHPVCVISVASFYLLLMKSPGSITYGGPTLNSIRCFSHTPPSPLTRHIFSYPISRYCPYSNIFLSDPWFSKRISHLGFPLFSSLVQSRPLIFICNRHLPPFGAILKASTYTLTPTLRHGSKTTLPNSLTRTIIQRRRESPKRFGSQIMSRRDWSPSYQRPGTTSSVKSL